MIKKAIDSLTFHCLKQGLLDPLDLEYARNRLFSLLKITGWVYDPDVSLQEVIPLDEALGAICRLKAKGNASPAWEDDLVSEVTDLFIDRPSGIVRQFLELYRQSPEDATDWLYHLADLTRYVKTSRSARNLKWEHPCEYGVLELSVNLAKPEKTPAEIALAQTRPSGYPYCVLCRENVGLSGPGHPPRAHHRIIPLKLADADYFFQYSPYAYFPEHAIVVSRDHVPMSVDGSMLRRMLDFTDQFPHYFLSSNADLPIVGGSILSHDHFQGGRAYFPVERAPRQALGEGSFLIEWPISTVLFTGPKAKVLQEGEALRRAWFGYSNEELGIRCETHGLRHNTLNHLARRTGEDEYEVYVLLRNNQTSPERPDGLFHTRPSLQVIKQENIGVIESIGLAILPPRIASALAEGFAGEEYSAWREEFRRFPDDKTRLGETYKKILCDCGVFKSDKAGRQALCSFLQSALPGNKERMIHA